MTLEEFLQRLSEDGGHIVSTNELTVFEISTARAEERLFVDDNGYGYVWMEGKN